MELHAFLVKMQFVITVIMGIAQMKVKYRKLSFIHKPYVRSEASPCGNKKTNKICENYVSIWFVFYKKTLNGIVLQQKNSTKKLTFAFH
jgi:hypothetical protein